MKTIELKETISKYLRENGTENFAKLISDSIDEAGPNNNNSIHSTRINFVKKFTALSDLLLTER